MDVDTGWERHRWGGAAGLRAERGRVRRLWKAWFAAGLLLAFGLLKVHLSAQVAARASRIDTLRSEIRRLEVDLTVDQSHLASRQIFGNLVGPAADRGFGPLGEYRSILVTEANSPAADGPWDQLAEELHRGSQLILPEALAQDLWGGSRVHGKRP